MVTKSTFIFVLRSGFLSSLILILITYVLFVTNTLAAMKEGIEWIHQFGTSVYDAGLDVAVDGSGNIYVTGATFGSLDGQPQGWGDVFISKYNSSGTQQWVHQFGTSDIDSGYSVAVDGSGNVYVTGYTNGSLEGTNQGKSDVFLSKYNLSGDQQWVHQFGTSDIDLGSGVAVDGSGNIYVTGYTRGSIGGANQGSYDVFLAKYNSGGDQQWIHQFGTGYEDYGYGVAVDGSSNVYVAGKTGGALTGANQGEEDAFLAKYNASGDQQWVRQFGTFAEDQGYDIAVDASGNAYVAGHTYGSMEGVNPGGADVFVAGYNASGDQQWIRQFGMVHSEVGLGVAVDVSGNVYATGWTDSSLGGANQGESDVFLAMYNSNGIQQWVRQLGSSGDDYGQGVAVDGSSNIYVSGFTYGSLEGANQGNSDVFIAAFSQSGTAPTPVATSTPAECTADDISVSPFSLTLKKKEKMKNAITVTVTGEDNCKVEGEKITAKVDSAGKKLFSVTPAGRKTKEDGTAVFSVKAKRKTGNATVTFSTGGGLSESLDVTVTK